MTSKSRDEFLLNRFLVPKIHSTYVSIVLGREIVSCDIRKIGILIQKHEIGCVI